MQALCNRFSLVFPPPFDLSRIDFEDDEFLFKGADTIILAVCPSDVNAAIAAANMELTANGMGLGMLYVGFFMRLVNVSKPLKKYKTYVNISPVTATTELLQIL